MRSFAFYHSSATGTLRVVIVITLLALVQGNFARVQNSGEMLKLEMQLAPYLGCGRVTRRSV